MKGRNVPASTSIIDERRVQACLTACADISTEALEAGLVHDVFDAQILLSMTLVLQSEIAAQGKDPARYIDLGGVLTHAGQVNARVAASGYDDAQNRAWEAEYGPSLGEQPDLILVPLGTSNQRAAR